MKGCDYEQQFFFLKKHNCKIFLLLKGLHGIIRKGGCIYRHNSSFESHSCNVSTSTFQNSINTATQQSEINFFFFLLVFKNSDQSCVVQILRIIAREFESIVSRKICFKHFFSQRKNNKLVLQKANPIHVLAHSSPFF